MLYSGLRLGSLPQDLRPSSFRKTALALTAAAFAAGASLATYPASAQQVSSNEYRGSPECAQFFGTSRVTSCEFNLLHQRGLDADKRAAAAEKSIQTTEASTKCIEGVILKINAAKQLAPLTPEQKTGFKAQLDSCNRS